MAPRFLSQERGSQVVEFAFCLPAVALFLGLILAFASFSGYQNRCQDIATSVLRDAVSWDGTVPLSAVNISEESYTQHAFEVAGGILSDEELDKVTLEVEPLEGGQFLEVRVTLDLSGAPLGTFIQTASSRIVGHVER
jgi:hypothetical protein